MDAPRFMFKVDIPQHVREALGWVGDILVDNHGRVVIRSTRPVMIAGIVRDGVRDVPIEEVVQEIIELRFRTNIREPIKQPIAVPSSLMSLIEDIR